MSAQSENAASDKTPEWMQQKEYGNIFWLRVMSRFSLAFGRRLSRTVVYGIALYFLLAVPAARKASRAYLVRCLKRPVTWLDLYRHFLAFASTIHDRFYLINDQYDVFSVRTFGTEPLRALHAGNGGLLLVGAHLGSFEILRSLARDNPQLKVCMAMYPENARRMNSTLAAINPQAMQDVIVLGKIDAILTMHNKVEEGAMIGMLADRASGPSQYVSIPFLGTPARFPTGPFRVAALLGKPVYFMTGLYRGANRYDIHFELLADCSKTRAVEHDAVVRDVLARYVATLERYCLDAPFNWFNFYDFWKT